MEGAPKIARLTRPGNCPGDLRWLVRSAAIPSPCLDLPRIKGSFGFRQTQLLIGNPPLPRSSPPLHPSIHPSIQAPGSIRRTPASIQPIDGLGPSLKFCTLHLSRSLNLPYFSLDACPMSTGSGGCHMPGSLGKRIPSTSIIDTGRAIRARGLKAIVWNAKYGSFVRPPLFSCALSSLSSGIIHSRTGTSTRVSFYHIDRPKKARRLTFRQHRRRQDSCSLSTGRALSIRGFGSLAPLLPHHVFQCLVILARSLSSSRV